MALMELRYYSEILEESSVIQIAFPKKFSEIEKFPLLCVAAPPGKNHSFWLRKVPLEEMAEQQKVMIAIPDMKMSSEVKADQYKKICRRMLEKELPQLLEGYFPVYLDLKKMLELQKELETL